MLLDFISIDPTSSRLKLPKYRKRIIDSLEIFLSSFTRFSGSTGVAPNIVQPCKILCDVAALAKSERYFIMQWCAYSSSFFPKRKLLSRYSNGTCLETSSITSRNSDAAFSRSNFELDFYLSETWNGIEYSLITHNVWGIRMRNSRVEKYLTSYVLRDESLFNGMNGREYTVFRKGRHDYSTWSWKYRLRNIEHTSATTISLHFYRHTRTRAYIITRYSYGNFRSVAINSNFHLNPTHSYSSYMENRPFQGIMSRLDISYRKTPYFVPTTATESEKILA